ncbi:lysophospholipid acyltransferase family protein [Devosia sp.]|uniref:lysophospholipid acyltransferase family protein n=1 Tax=Devosia sp. TaxID=1871048 RepID=UPI002AFF6F17|nr:lysophospholipid acyltransferase family protein [Devosia sp.]
MTIFRTAFQALRTALFYVVFIGQTVVIALVVGTIALFAGRTRLSWAMAVFWCHSNLAYLRIFTGLKTIVSGAENIPPGGCIIAAKHQSNWDVFAIFPHTGRPAYIAKKELMRIPFFGWAARSLDCIAIDRQKGAQAIPALIEESRSAIGRGCRLVIFPEGTRRAALAAPAYRQGIVRMYEALGVPVVPVALNSGLFWGRNSPIIWPGTAEARFLPAIEPGLPAEIFSQRLAQAIEGETEALTLQAIEKGLGRPLGPHLRQSLEVRRNSAT